MRERKDIITIFGNPLTLLGEPLSIGDAAPDFVVLDNDMEPKKLSDFKGRILIILAVPSLDTPVCSTEANRFNHEAASFGNEVQVLTISMDLPFAQKRWCGASGLKNVMTLSDHCDAEFGTKWGVLIKELRLLSRSVFIVGKDGLIKYTQTVPETTNEPDYATALDAVRALL